MVTTILLAGGDRRQYWLARLLESLGPVWTQGVPGLEDRRPREPVSLLVLPVPALDARGRIRGTALEPEDLAELWGENTLICGGALPGDLAARMPGCRRMADLLKDPETAAANGRLTAEAAVGLAMEALEGSLYDLDCGVLGWGRIGKPLAALLGACRARVTLGIRRREIRAEAAALGYAACPPALLGSRQVIFNTVPAQTVDPGSLDPDCLWVELASAPGGLPKGAPPCRVLGGNSLPGRRLPRSAAELLRAEILRLMEETE